MATKIGELEVEIEVTGGKEAAKDVDKVEDSLKDLKEKGSQYLSQFKLSGVAGFAAVGTAVVAVVGALAAGTKALFDFVSDTAPAYDRIDKMSKKVGLTAEEFQKLEFAAERSGAPIDAIADGLKTLTSMIDAQEKGGSELVTPFSQTLDELRISMEDLKKSNPQEQLEMIADALMGVQDPLERTQKGIYLLGETGAKELQPLFAAGAEGISALTDEAERYGLVTNEAIAAGAGFQDSMLNLETEMKSIKSEIFESLAPAFIEIVDYIKEWIGENDKFVSQDLPAILGTIGMALVDLTKWLFSVVDAWRGFIKEIQDSKSLLEHEYPNLFNILAGAINSLIHPIDGVKQVFEGWKGIFADIGEWIGGLIGGPFDKLTAWFSDTFPKATEMFGNAFAAIRKPIDAIGDVISALVERVKAFFDKFTELKALAQSLGLIDEDTRATTRGGATFLGGGEDLVNPEETRKKQEADQAARGRDEAARDASRKRREKSEGTALLSQIKADKRKPSSRENQRLQELGVTPRQIEAATKDAVPPKPAGGGGGKPKEEKTSTVSFGESLMAFRSGQGNASDLASNLNLISAKAPSAKGIMPTVAIDVYNFGPFEINVKSNASAKDIAKEVKDEIDKGYRSARAQAAIDLSSAVEI